MSSKLVSIVVPVYNSSLTISETLESVLAQTYSHWECLLIDDCSSDDSYRICSRYTKLDNRFILLRQPVNSGVSAARNLGLSRVNGDYIVFLDSDDYWHPDFLSHGISALRRGSRFVYAPYKRFLDTTTRPSFSRKVPSYVYLNSLLFNNHLPLFVCIFDRSLLSDLSFGSQRPEDYIFWIRLFSLNRGLVASRFSTSCLGYYRVSASQRSANKLLNVRRVYYVYRGVLDYSIIYSFFRVFLYLSCSFYDYISQLMSYFYTSLHKRSLLAK